MSTNTRVALAIIISEICAIHFIFRGVIAMTTQPLSSFMMIIVGLIILVVDFQIAVSHLLWEKEIRRSYTMINFLRNRSYTVIDSSPGTMFSAGEGPVPISGMINDVSQRTPTPENLKPGDVWYDSMNRMRIALSDGRSAIIEDSGNSTDNGDVFPHYTMGVDPGTSHGARWGVWPYQRRVINRVQSVFGGISVTNPPSYRITEGGAIIQQEQQQEQQEPEQPKLELKPEPEQPKEQKNNQKLFSSPIEDLEI